MELKTVSFDAGDGMDSFPVIIATAADLARDSESCECGHVHKVGDEVVMIDIGGGAMLACMKCVQASIDASDSDPSDLVICPEDDEPCAHCGEPIADDDRDELEPTMHTDCADEVGRIKADDYADSAYDRMMDERAERAS